MNRPFHILHVFPGFKIGGAQVRFVELVKGLGNQFSHTVIAMDGNHEAARLLPQDADVTLGDSKTAGASLMGRLSQYRRDIIARAPDLLVTYNWGSIEWVLANTILATPHIHIEDGFGPEEADHQISRRVWMRRLALRRSRIVVPSIALRDMAMHVWRLNGAHVHYIPNGIAPCDRYSTHIGDLGLDLPDRLPRIAWAGALRREKNLPRLLRAFEPLKKDAVLLIIGDGLELDTLLREAKRLSISSAIRFLGRREDARDILMQCDIMALSSDTEQMPLVVLEGMDAGLAVAATDVGDIRHMVCEENLPYIVKRSDPELGAAMNALVMDVAKRKAVGAANRARLRQTYLAQDMIAAYGVLFRQTAGARFGGVKRCA